VVSVATSLLGPPTGQVIRHRLSRAGDRKLNHATAPTQSSCWSRAKD
jgi:hypothetical protein